MKFSCDNCQARYQIPDEKVAGRKLKYVCRKCETPIILDGTAQTATTFDPATVRPSALPPAMSIPPTSLRPSALSLPPTDDAATLVPASMPPPRLSPTPSAPPPMRTPSLPPELPVWHVAIDGTPRGPMRLEQVRKHLEAGEAHPASLAWRDGQDDWLPLGEIPALAALLPAPSLPPLPAPSTVRTPSVNPPEPPLPEPPVAAPLESLPPPEPVAPARISTRPLALDAESAQPKAHDEDDHAAVLGRGNGLGASRLLAIALVAAGVGGLAVYLGKGSPEAETRVQPPVATATATAPDAHAPSTGSAGIGDNAMTDVGEDDSFANALVGEADAGAPSARPSNAGPSRRPGTSGAAAATQPTENPSAEPSQAANPEPAGSHGPAGPELTAAQIREVYRRNQGRVQSCYDRAATMVGNAPDARLQVTVRILPNGTVGRVSITGNDFAGLSACVQRVVQTWVFPASAQGGQTTFPFVFSGM